MVALYVTFLVLLSDQALKILLQQCMGRYAIPLGPFGVVQIVAGRLWLQRLGLRWGTVMLWSAWTAAGIPLLIISILLPASAAFVGLLLGGSLSQCFESSMHGKVTDYVCLRFWPTFNLADLALAVGTLGMLWELVTILHTRL
jgi:lipoprotein signal peptidase